jgi:hypothetical protein
MTRAKAEAESKRLAAQSPERATHRWVPRDDGNGHWSVLRIALAPTTEPTGAETRGDERPPTPDDPRPVTWQNVPPWAAGG